IIVNDDICRFRPDVAWIVEGAKVLVSRVGGDRSSLRRRSSLCGELYYRRDLSARLSRFTSDPMDFLAEQQIDARGLSCPLLRSCTISSATVTGERITALY